jgi:hypothetical protein
VPPVPPPTLHLHFKVLTEPKVPRANMLAAMQQTFAAVGINVVVDPFVENLTLPLLVDLDVGACPIDAAITAEQGQLFAYRNNVPDNEICVYFVRTMCPPKSGCASRMTMPPRFPNGRPSAIIAAAASRWTLAHECGHVLGLPHADPQERVMNERTWRITRDPPDLTPIEGNLMKASPFMH